MQQFSFWQYKGRPQRAAPAKYLKELIENSGYVGKVSVPSLLKNISKKPELKLLQ